MVMYESVPGQGNSGDLDELAQLTAAEAFNEADINHDGKISFEEFKTCYNKPVASGPAGEALDTAVNAYTGNALLTLEGVRTLTRLGSFTVDEVLERFASVTDEEGLVHRQKFYDCILEIADPEGAIWTVWTLTS